LGFGKEEKTKKRYTKKEELKSQSSPPLVTKRIRGDQGTDYH